MSVPKTHSPKVPRWQRAYQRQGLLYILPAMLLFALLIIYPIFKALYLSLFDYSILEPEATRYVGVENYGGLFTQQANTLPFWNTLYFTALFVPPFVGLSLILAVMLNRIRRGSTLLRSMIFAPVVVSLAVSAVMWALFFDETYGLAQQMLNSLCNWINFIPAHLGLGDWVSPPAGLLKSPRTAMLGIVILAIWNGLGVNVILYLVGLQRIGDELYEAAAVDGAGPLQRFWRITLPQLRPMTYLIVLLSLIGSLKVFAQPYIMTAGGPADSTKTYVMSLYLLAFRSGQFQLGQAAAMACMLAVFIFLTSLLLRRINKAVE